MTEDKKPVEVTEEVKEDVTLEVTKNAEKEDFEKRSKLFLVDLEIASKRHQIGLQSFIVPTGTIIQTIDLKNVKK